MPETNEASRGFSLLSPEVVRWELLVLMAVLVLIARTGSTAGEYLRTFSQLLFP